MIVGYPEIRTNLIFINVPTVPLEQRIGVEKINKYGANDNTNHNRRDDIPDGMCMLNPCVDIQKNKNFPINRYFTDSQLLIMNGAKNSTISLDKISILYQKKNVNVLKSKIN